jgi:hypothetical protein
MVMGCVRAATRAGVQVLPPAWAQCNNLHRTAPIHDTCCCCCCCCCCPPAAGVVCRCHPPDDGPRLLEEGDAVEGDVPRGPPGRHLPLAQLHQVLLQPQAPCLHTALALRLLLGLNEPHLWAALQGCGVERVSKQSGAAVSGSPWQGWWGAVQWQCRGGKGWMPCEASRHTALPAVLTTGDA